MIEALAKGVEVGLWSVGFFSAVFVGFTLLAAIVKVGRHFSGYPKG